MSKVIKTFEEFIGDKQSRRETWREAEVELRPPLNTNNPDQRYDVGADGSDQVNRSLIGKKGKA